MINLHDINDGIPDNVKSWVSDVKKAWKDRIIIRYRRDLKILDFRWPGTTMSDWTNVAKSDLELHHSALLDNQKYIDTFTLDMLIVE